MTLVNLYAQLQLNPRNVAVYRQLAEYYRSVGKTNEADAFLELIRRKFHADDPASHEEQRQDNRGNS